MRMRGKLPIFNYKDTFDLGSTLDPIICAGLRKFLEVTKASLWRGVPCGFSDDSLEDGGLSNWEGAIEKMIYAFDRENDPNINKYNFSFVHSLAGCPELGSRFSLECTNEVECDRYNIDCEKHQALSDEGRELFSKHYNSLWW